jgi:hypothetical protein
MHHSMKNTRCCDHEVRVTDRQSIDYRITAALDSRAFVVRPAKHRPRPRISRLVTSQLTIADDDNLNNVSPRRTRPYLTRDNTSFKCSYARVCACVCARAEQQTGSDSESAACSTSRPDLAVHARVLLLIIHTARTRVCASPRPGQQAAAVISLASDHAHRTHVIIDRCCWFCSGSASIERQSKILARCCHLSTIHLESDAFYYF